MGGEAYFVLAFIAIIAVFLLIAIRISTQRYDGTLTVSHNEHGSTITLNVAPSDLIDKNQVRLKIIPPENRIENKD